mgnify:CR=1 FL=1
MFNPHIMVIKNGEMVLGIEDIKVDYTKRDYYVKINDKDNRRVFQGKLTPNSLIDIDISLGLINIDYCEDETGVVFYKDTIDLQNYGKVAKSSVNKSKEELLREKVYMEMDNPKGNVEDIQKHTLMLKKSAFDKNARQYVENKIRQILLKEKSLTNEDVEVFTKKLYADLYGMSILQELDDDKDVSEILVNASIYPKFECSIYYTKTNEGKKQFDKTFKDKEELLNIFSKSIAFSKKELNSLENAIIEATRANGDRVNLIIPEASENYVLNIRKFSNFVPTKENMLTMGTINEDIDYLMKALVEGKANIGIGGEMGTGKTTFINYLLGYTEPLERKVVISSVKEIDVSRVLKGHDIVFLNVDEDKGFTFGKLMKTALRTTADRIIVPESRGGEFKKVYEANLKTKGNMFTAHALTDSGFLDVCADMYMEDSNSDAHFIKNKIAKSIDIIVIMKKIDNQIRIKSISEVLLDENSQFKGLNLLYYWDFGGRGKSSVGYKRTENNISENLKQRLFEEGVPFDVIDNL